MPIKVQNMNKSRSNFWTTGREIPWAMPPKVWRRKGSLYSKEAYRMHLNCWYISMEIMYSILKKRNSWRCENWTEGRSVLKQIAVDINTSLKGESINFISFIILWWIEATLMYRSKNSYPIGHLSVPGDWFHLRWRPEIPCSPHLASFCFQVHQTTLVAF